MVKSGRMVRAWNLATVYQGLQESLGSWRQSVRGWKKKLQSVVLDARILPRSGNKCET